MRVHLKWLHISASGQRSVHTVAIAPVLVLWLRIDDLGPFCSAETRSESLRFGKCAVVHLLPCRVQPAARHSVDHQTISSCQLEITKRCQQSQRFAT